MKVLAFPGPKHEPSPAVDEEVVAPVAIASPSLDGEGPRAYDRITIRAITVAIVLSMFVHFAILFIPMMNKVDQELKAPADEIGPLSVTIAQSNPQPPAPQQKQEAAAEKTTPTPTPTPPKPAPKTRPTPPKPRPQIAINTGSTPPFVVPPPTTIQPPAPEAVPTPQPIVPTTDDFSERLAANQRARRAQNGGAPDSVLESDDQRANRIAKANIAAQTRSSSPGQDQSEAGGIFELKRTGASDAEFVFNGWNRDFRRKLGKVYEVKQGSNPSIQLAVIRQMIEIIREQQPGDFEWYSYRLKGRSVVMSARPKDQKELEAFLMQEFYGNDPRVR